MISDYEKEMAERLTALVFPVVLEKAVRNGQIDTKRLDDAEYVREAIRACFDSSIEQMEAVVLIHEEFVIAAKEAFKAGRHKAGIVLIATAIEQTLNLFYRSALEEKNLLSEDEITEFIRASSTRHKFGILLVIVANYELDMEFQKQINDIFELRNAIVHYKAKSGSVFSNTKVGSYDYINEQLAKLNIEEVLELPDILLETLNEALELLKEQNPDYEAIKKLKAMFAPKEEASVDTDACPD